MARLPCPCAVLGCGPRRHDVDCQAKELMGINEFKELLHQKGVDLYRTMPWRTDTRPYYVLVSELMLQQTQVSRVIPKFERFIERFPDEKTLAVATLAEVLDRWNGLGYNRRAKYLHDSAKMIMNEYGGRLPMAEAELLKLPGVGINTVGAVLAYAYNQPSIFVETNIRTVFIHHFFTDDFGVSDRQIIELLEATIDRTHPREFYWALMDYGSWLKQQGIRNNYKSRHYKRQTALAGSVREMRGRIVAALQKVSLNDADLSVVVQADERYTPAIDGLRRDGLIQQRHGVWQLTQ